MKGVNYRTYAIESLKITSFCLIVAAIFKLLGATDTTLLVVFNMAVISSAVTFSTEQKHLSQIVLGSSIVVISIIIGGILGYYIPWLTKLITIIYAGLAFYLPKSNSSTTIYVIGSLMFLIFSALPFPLETAINYAFDGLAVIIIFIVFYLLVDRPKHTPLKETTLNKKKSDNIPALNVVLSLSVAFVISHILSLYSGLTHLYWIELTILVVIKSSQNNTIHTSLKRIAINALGAIIIVVLFNYVIPYDFLINFFLLILFLFCIFFFGFSYVGRTLFIELFVLNFTNMLGQFHDALALDRVILTLIGGMIVIAMTPISNLLFNILFYKKQQATR